MKLFNSLLMAALALTSYTSATPVDFSKRSEPISVQLTASNNSVVKVVVINNGETRLNLLTSGTILDDKLPVERLTLHSNN
jgi:deuterolysin